MLDLNHPSCLELTLACAPTGCANAVVNFRLAPPPEIVYVINDARACILLVGPEFAAAVAPLRDKLPLLERVIPIDSGTDGYEAWLAAHPSSWCACPTRGVPCRCCSASASPTPSTCLR